VASSWEEDEYAEHHDTWKQDADQPSSWSRARTSTAQRGNWQHKAFAAFKTWSGQHGLVPLLLLLAVLYPVANMALAASRVVDTAASSTAATIKAASESAVAVSDIFATAMGQINELMNLLSHGIDIYDVKAEDRSICATGSDAGALLKWMIPIVETWPRGDKAVGAAQQVASRDLYCVSSAVNEVGDFNSTGFLWTTTAKLWRVQGSWVLHVQNREVSWKAQWSNPVWDALQMNMDVNTLRAKARDLLPSFTNCSSPTLVIDEGSARRWWWPLADMLQLCGPEQVGHVDDGWSASFSQFSRGLLGVFGLVLCWAVCFVKPRDGDGTDPGRSGTGEDT
jgi:hypothetical protein